VYKFLDARWGEEAIRRRRLKISLINELNDPYEGICAKFGSRRERLAWATSQRSFAKRYGLLCFSLKWSDPVLWSHYSDQHRGLSLGFDVPANVPAQIVAYSNELVDGRQISIWDQERKRSFAKKVYSTKYLFWQYEAEVRYFCDLQQRDKYTGLYFLEFGEELELREVIFGARFSGDAPWIRKMTSECKDISFTTARLAFQNFSVVPQKNRQLQM
jgi:hypothetical protein